ncbi:transcription termination/antitermination protein NusG [Clostridia bacterium]|nr:transcription termination/antitermination protein NusG [Clostridia bacterium]
MAEASRWYVVHTYSGYENKVLGTIQKTIENRNLGELIQQLLVPTEEMTEIAADGKHKTKIAKVFPGYVLIKMVMTDESWHVVRNTRGVTGFVGPGSKPIPLTDEEVAALGVEKREVVVSYKEGDTVKITDGPLENFVGQVEEIDLDKNMVRVVVSMFGRETPVELELDQVMTIDS